MASTGEVKTATPATPGGYPATGSLALTSRSVLARWWGARGFFGGLLAIGLALLGQQALIERSNTTEAGRYYLAAIAILILSLLHPTLRWRRRKRVIAAPAAPAASEPASPTTLISRPSRSRTVAERLASTPLNDSLLTAESQTGTHPPVPWTPEAVPAKAEPVATERRSLSLGARWVGLRTRLGWRATIAGLVLALGFALASALVLLGEITSPLGGWLWATALITLVVALIGAPPWPFPKLRITNYELRITSQNPKSAMPGPESDFFARGLPRLSARVEAVLVAAMLALGLVLRLIDLEYMPGIFGDEGERGMDARAINEGGQPFLFGYGWWGVPNLYFYLMSFMLRIFGDSMVGARMLSVISGMVAVWFIYRTGRVLWGPRAGLMAGALLAISPLALQFSRLAGESTPTGALWAVGLYFLVMALRHNRFSDWALSGIAWGFSLYFYAAGKLIIPVVALIALYCLVRWRIDFFKRYAVGFALLAFAFALIFMPYGIFSYQENWQGFMGRAQETSIFSPPNQAVAFGKYGISYDPTHTGESLVKSLLSQPVPWARLVFEQMRVTLDVIYKSGDPTPFYQIQEHAGSMLSPVWAALALLGLAYAAWKVWDPRFGLISIMFWGGMLGAALTLDTPSVQRLTGAWPVLMLFPAVLLDRVFAAAWPLNLSLARRWATVPLAGLLIFFTVESYREYFGHYASLCPYCDATAQARYGQALGQDYKAYQLGVGDYHIFFNYGSTRFVAKGVEGADMAVPSDFFPITDNNGKGLAFLVYANNHHYLPIIRLFYPDGKEETISSPDGIARFVSYKVAREQVAAIQTARARYEVQGGQPIEKNEPNVGTNPAGEEWSPPPGLGYPTKATWRSLLVVPQYGSYIFYLEGAEDSTLEVDGRTVLTQSSALSPQHSVELVLAKGVHDVLLSGTLADANSRISLLWAGTGGPPTPIAPNFLYTHPNNIALGGLSGEVGPYSVQGISGAELVWEQPPFLRRTDPFFGFREATPVLGGAAFMGRWEGQISVHDEGDYLFEAISNGPSMVLIDGQTVVDNAAAGSVGSASAQVRLAAGLHPIEVRYGWLGGPARLELFWTPPGRERAILPPSALVPGPRSWPRSEMPNAPLGHVPQSPDQQAQAKVEPDATLGAEAGLSNPRGLAVDAQGNIYIGDRGNGRIVVLSPDGKVAHTWGKLASQETRQNPGPGEFADIVDVAVSKEGVVYVSDWEAKRLHAFDREGRPLRTWDSSSLQVSGANGISVAPDGSILLADTLSSRLAKLPPNAESGGQGAQVLDIGEATRLEQPLDVAADSAGNLYAVDLNERILKVAPDGEVTIFGVQVGKSDGGSRLAVSPDGQRVYMSDPDRQRVAVLNVADGIVTHFGEAGSGPGQFGAPSGIAVGEDGRVYVLDRANNNVQVFKTPEE